MQRRKYEAPKGLNAAQTEQFYRLSEKQQRDYVALVAETQAKWAAEQRAKVQQMDPLKRFVQRSRAKGKKAGLRDDAVERKIKRHVDSKKLYGMSVDWDAEELLFYETVPVARKARKPSAGKPEPLDAEAAKMREMRAKRFSSTTRSPSSSTNRSDLTAATKRAVESGRGVNLEDFVVVGTCEDLEKEYLRLTAAPDPNIVRPLRVLTKSFALVIDKHARDYPKLSTQLRSIRQDLTVQHIRNEFTTQVYVHHAREALKNGPDLNELNQILTVLLEGGLLEEHCSELMDEFLAYRILYFVFTKAKYKRKAACREIAVGALSSKARRFCDAFETGSYYEMLQMRMQGALAALVEPCACYRACAEILKACAPSAKLPRAIFDFVTSERVRARLIGDESAIDVAASKANFAKNYEFPVVAGDNVVSS